MNRAWFFGDSFTAGFGARKDTEYYSKYGPGQTFTKRVSEYFKVEEINVGVPGCDNETILSKITENLIHFHKGDFVIIGNTSPLRGLTPSNDGTKLIYQKLFDSKPYSESKGYSDNQASEILQKYCIKFKSGYEELWSSHYNKMFLDIIKYLKTKDITALLWDYSVWSEEIEPGMRFENIEQHTKGDIYDLHWSFEGHRKVAEWIVEGLNSDKIYLK